MRTAVIGASGFIGRHLCDTCRGNGDTISVLVRNTRDAERYQAAGIRAELGSLADENAVARACAGADVVFNLAGALGRWGTQTCDLAAINAFGAGVVMRCAARSGALKVVHTSTAGVSGPLPHGIYAVEDYPLDPATDYQKTKLEGEQIALREHEVSRLPLTIVRPAFVYGPGDTHKLPLFRAVARRRVILVNGGISRLHPIFVDDVIQGLLVAARLSPGDGEAYILAGPRPVTIRNLIEELARALAVPPPAISLPGTLLNPLAALAELLGRTVHKEPPLTKSRLDLFSSNYAYCTDRARDTLGFKPLVELPAGIRITAEWYRDRGYLQSTGQVGGDHG